MATPALKASNVPITITDLTAGQAVIKTFNADGSVLDVSSGYTVNGLICTPASNPNGGGPTVDMSTHVTPTFTTTGVTLNWTAAQASAMVGLLQSLNNNYNLNISNDVGSTAGVAGFGTFNVNTYSGTRT